MKKETSYGIIPLRFYQNGWQILLIQHHGGYWAFPKGHADANESPQETAARELYEETGLTVQRYLSTESMIENYFFSFRGQRISKTVHYFLALVEGKVVIQESEIQASQWLAISEAYHHMTFKEGKRICLEVIEFLKGVDKEGHGLIL